MAIQIWRHNPSGCVYAVEVNDKGKVVKASADLHYSEVEQAKLGFENEPEQAEWIEENKEKFFLVQ